MKTWAMSYSCKLMEAGIISYEDSGAGIAYLTKQTIDKIAPSLIGKPVVIRHQKVTPDNQDKLAVGYVTGVYFNPQDAWHYVNFLLTSDKLEPIERDDGSFVFKAPDGEILDGISGAYDVTNTNEGGVWHDIKFDAEILDGSFTHLAIVTNPRYEETNKITQQGNMVLMNGKVAYQMENAADHDAMFAKEKKDHPEFSDEDIEKIVQDHIREKQNAAKESDRLDISAWADERTKEIIKDIEGYIKDGMSKDKAIEITLASTSMSSVKKDKIKEHFRNSKEGSVNKIYKIFRRIINGKDEKEEEVPDLVINVGGKEVSVKEAVNAYVANEKDEADEAEKKKKDDEAAENAKSLKMAKDDDTVVINGKSVSIADLKNAVEKRNKKNASESDDDKAKREEKENKKNSILNAIDYGDGKTEADARAKLKEMGYSEAEIEQALKTKKEGYEKSKENSKIAATQEKLNSKKAVGEIFIANNSKLEVGADIEHEAKHYNVTEPDTQDGKPGYWAKENAKKGEEFFMKIENAGKNVPQERDTTGPMTRSERAQAGRERYGSKNQK